MQLTNPFKLTPAASCDVDAESTLTDVCRAALRCCLEMPRGNHRAAIHEIVDRANAARGETWVTAAQIEAVLLSPEA